MNFTIGSLFDGSGGFPLAATMCGGAPLWASEIEPFPIAVTKSRFPNMKHLGSVTDVKGNEVEPVDVITFGSPCQDLSVAGKRAGLKHADNGDEETTRSGLLIEAVRIIKEMRESTNGVYPRFAVWENVPGAFSSNKGEDFRTVCEELIKIVEPGATMPAVPKNGWPYADCYFGDGWSLAYRVYDAQYWGVPQRRRRIYLVLDLRGECAGQVSFERKGVRGHFETGRTPWQGNTGVATDCSGTTNCERACVALADVAATLRAGAGAPKHESDFIGRLVIETLTYAVEAGDVGNPIVLDRAFFNQGQNAQYDPQLYQDGTVPTLVARGPAAVVVRYIVRRLTPTECARLQGFADTWAVPDHKKSFTDEEYRFWLTVRNTHAEINGKAAKEYTKAQMLKWYNTLHTDSSEYKLWGNGIALPTALYVMQGISDVLKGEYIHV